jgi:hypothetical protein
MKISITKPPRSTTVIGVANLQPGKMYRIVDDYTRRVFMTAPYYPPTKVYVTGFTQCLWVHVTCVDLVTSPEGMGGVWGQYWERAEFELCEPGTTVTLVASPDNK